jgi:argininosuccinate lyase
MKALPLSYNRDMQEDKEALFDTVDTLNSCLETMAGMVAGLRVKRERMEQAAREGYILATDLADYLVKKGMPFREAHRAVKELVAYAIKKKKGPAELDLQEYRSFSPLFERDVLSITLESSLQARRAPGGTAPETVDRALKDARKGLESED